MRKTVFDTRPDFLNYAPTRDYVMIVECALKGYIYYSPEYMSAQRVAANSSLTQLWNSNPELWEDYIKKQMILLDKINEETNHQFDIIISNEKINQMFSNMLIRNDREGISQSPYKELYEKMPLKKKLRYLHPQLFFLLSKTYRLFKNEKKNFQASVQYENF